MTNPSFKITFYDRGWPHHLTATTEKEPGHGQTQSIVPLIIDKWRLTGKPERLRYMGWEVQITSHEEKKQ